MGLRPHCLLTLIVVPIIFSGVENFRPLQAWRRLLALVGVKARAAPETTEALNS